MNPACTIQSNIKNAKASKLDIYISQVPSEKYATDSCAEVEVLLLEKTSFTGKKNVSIDLRCMAATPRLPEKQQLDKKCLSETRATKILPRIENRDWKVTSLEYFF